MSNFPQVSPNWFRLRFSEEALRGWCEEPLPSLPNDLRPDDVIWPNPIRLDEKGSRDAGQVITEPVPPGTFAYIRTESGEWVASISISESDNLGEDFYDLVEAYDSAQTQLDPELSPHTAFRALKTG